MRYTLIYILILIVFFQNSYSQELRLEAGIDYTIKKINIGLETELRKPSIINNDYLGLIQTEIGYEISKRFDFEIAYRFKTNIEEFYPESHVEYNNKHRLTFEIAYNLKRFDNDIKLKDAIRYQTNFSESGKIKNYLRNEFELNYKLTNVFKPYIAPIVYYNIDENRFSEFRIKLGSEFEFGKNSIDIFYIIEIDIARIERTRYIVGIAYGFSL
ncbi:MAG: DUF2490 domain-containing protein [Bacteroidales bacterium]|nr:DUF2490 domain-containing protein [Bacteroidales bacterium]MDD4218258.1 DUF2490 domain-containing protein [Bacteroidales bacterium]MDY0143118.1 DUF2490 domain-containing protein [Bacteroidales bacterium]